MKKTNTHIILLAVVALAASGLISNSSQAAVIYEENFTGPDGSLPTGWVTSQGFPTQGAIENNMLLNGSLNFTTYTTQSFGPGVTGYEITWNLMVSGALSGNPDQSTVLYFGYDSARDPSNGPTTYSVGISSKEWWWDRFLFIDDQREVRGNTTSLAQTNIGSYDFNYSTVYTMKILYTGDSISASLYDGLNMIGSVSQSTGIVPLTGEIGFYSVSPQYTDSITITAVPEPSSLALSGIAATVALLTWKRRRMQNAS